MTRYILFILFLFFSFNINSQIGIKIAYNNTQYSEINEILNQATGTKEQIFNNIFLAGINYDLSIERTGIVLMPGVSYGMSYSKIEDHSFNLHRISFDLPFKIYPMNTEGDCGCPDFSLRNKFFEKHLFFLLSPSYIIDMKDLKTENINYKISNSYFKIGLGAGITIPIVESFSISPTILYNWAFKDYWSHELFPTSIIPEKIKTNYTDINLEIRIHYRFSE